MLEGFWELNFEKKSHNIAIIVFRGVDVSLF
jgi:hypothetical protein